MGPQFCFESYLSLNIFFYTEHFHVLHILQGCNSCSQRESANAWQRRDAPVLLGKPIRSDGMSQHQPGQSEGPVNVSCL